MAGLREGLDTLLCGEKNGKSMADHVKIEAPSMCTASRRKALPKRFGCARMKRTVIAQQLVF